MRGTFLVIGILTAALSLAACGGGGGGGGGTPAGPSFTAAQEAKINSVFPMGTLTQDHLSPVESSGGFITKTADGIRIERTGSVDNRVVNFSALSDDFTAWGDYLLAMTSTSGSATGGYSGTFHVTDAVRLGGKMLGLQHADFGAWTHDATYNIVGSSLASGSGIIPFHMGDQDKKANFSALAGTGTVNFSGNTLAAFDERLLEGTIELSIDTNSLSNSSAEIKLPSFYNFTVPLAVGADGSMTKGSGAVGYVLNGSGTYRKIYGVSGASVNGQFYGNSPGSPTEAAGRYDMALQVKDSVGVSHDKELLGSFGVKR